MYNTSSMGHGTSETVQEENVYSMQSNYQIYAMKIILSTPVPLTVPASINHS